MSGDDFVEYEITIHRSELIPGAEGARVGYSDDFPGKKFLILPQCSRCGGGPGAHDCGRDR